MDAEFRSILSSTSTRLASGEINTSEAGEIFVSLCKAHLERYGILKESRQETTQVIRRTRQIQKVTEHLRQLKNSERKMMRQNKASFNNLVRAHNKAKKMCDQLTTNSNIRVHERAFRPNPWHYAKKLCDDKTSKPHLECPSKQTFVYFAASTKDDGAYSAIPPWVSEVQTIPGDEDLMKFDLSPITPSLVKKVLKTRSSGSALGEDGITYILR